MQVQIIGPNLPDQSKGSFHVHATGCADVRRSPDYRSPEFMNDRATSYDFASRIDVAEFIYSDIIAEDDEQDGPLDESSVYLNDIHFFPCTDALPLEAPAVAKEETVWLTVRVDEDGNMVVRDEVEAIESSPIETVMRPPKDWAKDVHTAILELLERAGQDVNTN